MLFIELLCTHVTTIDDVKLFKSRGKKEASNDQKHGDDDDVKQEGEQGEEE